MQGKKKISRIQKRPHAAARAHSKSRWSRPSVQGETLQHVRFRGTSERSRVFSEAACCSLEAAEAAPVSWAPRREQAQLAGRASHVLSREGSASIRQGRLCILTLLNPAPALLSPGGRKAGEVTPHELGTSWGFWAGGKPWMWGHGKDCSFPLMQGRQQRVKLHWVFMQVSSPQHTETRAICRYELFIQARQLCTGFHLPSPPQAPAWRCT